MTAYRIDRYDTGHYQTWNDFIEKAKNSTFLFHRDFMDYHSDRFQDASLLIYKNDKLVAVIPANKVDNTIYSHQGLSYGGLVVDRSVKFQTYIELVMTLLEYLESRSIDQLYWKELPMMYSGTPSSEWRYITSVLNAELDYTHLLSVIDLRDEVVIAANRMEGVKKAERHRLKIKEENEFSEFWDSILIPNLKKRHNVKPVHDLSEIELLKQRFPKNIRQFNVYKNEKLVAGATIFETDRVGHVQYISADDDRSELGSLDFLFHHLITSVFEKKHFFDFGTSNENKGKTINKGLLYWKEGFGARSLTQDFYKIETKNHVLLKDVLK